MTAAQINDIATIVAIAGCGIPILGFVLTYGIGSPWYRSLLGVVMFGLGVSILVLLCVISARRLFGEYPGYEWVAITAYSLLGLAFWALWAIVIIERRRGPALSIPLRRGKQVSMEWLKRFAGWFSAARRQAVQVTLTSAATLLVAVGLSTDAFVQPWLVITAATLQAAGPLLALVNLRRSEFASWFAVSARGVLYGLAASVAPALTALGFITEQQGTLTLTAISIGLTVISNGIAVFVGAQQETQRVEQAAQDKAVIGVLMSPVASQLSQLTQAARRLGVDEDEVTREMYRIGSRSE